MRFETGFPLLLIAGIALQDAVVTHDPTLHFVKPDLVAILHGMRLLAAANDVGMFFEEAHQLLTRRHLFPLQNPAGGLVDHLPGSWNEGFQGLRQALGPQLRLFLQLLLSLNGPLNGLLGYRQQFLILLPTC